MNIWNPTLQMAQKVAILNVMQSKPKQQCFIVSLLQSAAIRYRAIHEKEVEEIVAFRCCITSQMIKIGLKCYRQKLITELSLNFTTDILCAMSFTKIHCKKVMIMKN